MGFKLVIVLFNIPKSYFILDELPPDNFMHNMMILFNCKYINQLHKNSNKLKCYPTFTQFGKRFYPKILFIFKYRHCLPSRQRAACELVYILNALHEFFTCVLQLNLYSWISAITVSMSDSLMIFPSWSVF